MKLLKIAMKKKNTFKGQWYSAILSDYLHRDEVEEINKEHQSRSPTCFGNAENIALLASKFYISWQNVFIFDSFLISGIVLIHYTIVANRNDYHRLWRYESEWNIVQFTSFAVLWLLCFNDVPITRNNKQMYMYFFIIVSSTIPLKKSDKKYVGVHKKKKLNH